MEQYLSAVGFKDYVENKKIKDIVQKIINNPTEKYISNYGKDKIKVELLKEYGDTFGIIVRGELDENEEMKIFSVIPYKKGKLPMDIDEVDVIYSDNKDDYYVYFEDIKTGNPITFYLQNVVDYLDIDEDEEAYVENIRLVALSTEGTVILPINKDQVDKNLEQEEEEWRANLLELARDGDEEALQLLEIDAEQSAELFKVRTKHEDLLTILEGFFIPYGLNDAEYSILGTIEDFKIKTNSLTKEKVYILDLICLNFKLQVCVNKKDLVGVPSKGMRFKGICYVEGYLEFS
ncbi:DUF3881 family protein [Vallitalea longa]|uniref:DUF3881 family protein n=1 Tax=Vallitalea longa TaxID=2936439 RepID=UPI002492D78D|nr:DUF3881 family protein [Vallitalea longa]